MNETDEIKGKRAQLEALLMQKSQLIVVQNFDLFVEEMKIDEVLGKVDQLLFLL